MAQAPNSAAKSASKAAHGEGAVMVTSRTISCDGGGGALGHPRTFYTIGEEEVADKERQDILLALAKAVANTTAALVLKAKNVASKCHDQPTQNRVRCHTK